MKIQHLGWCDVGGVPEQRFQPALRAQERFCPRRSASRGSGSLSTRGICKIPSKDNLGSLSPQLYCILKTLVYFQSAVSSIVPPPTSEYISLAITGCPVLWEGRSWQADPFSCCSTGISHPFFPSASPACVRNSQSSHFWSGWHLLFPFRPQSSRWLSFTTRSVNLQENPTSLIQNWPYWQSFSVTTKQLLEIV